MKEEAGKHRLAALEQCCPKGMFYIGIEYECSKNYDLVFHSKQYLKSHPETRQGSSHFLMMRLKPDQETETSIIFYQFSHTLFGKTATFAK